MAKSVQSELLDELRGDGPSALSETVEDYLRVVAMMHSEGRLVSVGRLSTFLEVTPASVSGNIKRLTREGLLYLDQHHVIQLTPVGDIAAQTVRRRHALAECFLLQVLEMPWTEVYVNADRFEHTISPRVERRLQVLLGHPQVCPHGNPVDGSGRQEGLQLLPLMTPGDYVVHCVQETCAVRAGVLSVIEEASLLPGRSFKLVEVRDGFVRVRVKDDERTLPPSIAEVLLIRAEAAVP